MIHKKSLKKQFRKLLTRLTNLNKKILTKKDLRMLGDKDSNEEKENNRSKFNFSPNFAGMPFPPFLLNGPHFHPPIKVVINTLPHPNTRAGNFY